MSEQTADVLDQAADLIEKAGWCQGTMHARDGSHCTIGALSIVTPLNPALFNQAATVVARHIHHEYETDSGIGIWNDSPSRTKQEVLDMLRAAAKEQRK